MSDLYYVTADITDDGEKKIVPRAWMVRAFSEVEAKAIAREEVKKSFPMATINAITVEKFTGAIE